MNRKHVFALTLLALAASGDLYSQVVDRTDTTLIDLIEDEVYPAMPGTRCKAGQDRGYEGFLVPSATEKARWREITDAMLAEDLDAAADLIQVAGFPYDVVNFTDASTSLRYHLLLEKVNSGPRNPDTRKVDWGWGTYLFSPAENVPGELSVQVCHPRYDKTTPGQGIELFIALDAKTFLIAGTHRYANGGDPRCPGIGTDSADVAKGGIGAAASTMFQVVFEQIVNAEPLTRSISLFRKDPSDEGGEAPHIVLSNGALPPALREPGDPITVVSELSRDLCHALTSEFAEVPGFVEDCIVFDGANSALGGVDNPQGHFVNAQQVRATEPFMPGLFIQLAQDPFVSSDEGDRVALALENTLATAFDNGQWTMSIEERVTADGQQMATYIDDEFRGFARAVHFRNRVESGSPIFPEVAVISSEGLIHLKQGASPDPKDPADRELPFGAAVKLGPGYVDDAGFLYATPLVNDCLISTADLLIDGTGPVGIHTEGSVVGYDQLGEVVVGGLDITCDLTLGEPSDDEMVLELVQAYEVVAPFSLDEGRETENFRLVQMQTLFLSDQTNGFNRPCACDDCGKRTFSNCHHSSGVRFVDGGIAEVALDFKDVFPAEAPGAYLLAEQNGNPLRSSMGSGFFDCVHNDDMSWRDEADDGYSGNTPNLRVLLDDADLARESIPQGYIHLKETGDPERGDPTNDNVDLWLQNDQGQVLYLPGDSGSVRYWVVARDDPASPDLSLSASSLMFGGVPVGLAERKAFVVLNTGDSDLVVRPISSSLADFAAVEPSQPFRVAPGDLQAVSVEFAPREAGLRSGVLLVLSNDPDAGSAIVSVSGTGLDDTSPRCTGTTPPDGAIVPVLPTVVIQLWDDLDVDEAGTAVMVTRDGSPFSTFARNDSIPNTVVITFPAPMDGVYEIGIIPMDETGNPGAPCSATITADSEPPQFLGSDPPDGAGLPALAEATLHLSDNRGVDEAATLVSITHDQQPFTGFTRDNSAADQVRLAFTAAPDGIYDILVTPIDIAGNRGIPRSVRLVVDDTPPSVVGSDPADGALLQRLDQVVIALADDVDVDEEGTLVAVTRDAVPATYTRVNSLPNHVIIDFPAPTSGLYRLRVQPRDAAGNLGDEVIIQITADAVPPTFLESTPADGDVVGVLRWVEFSFEDNVGLDEAATAIQSGKCEPFTIRKREHSVPDQVRVKIRTSGDGEYCFDVQPVDEAGNAGEWSAVTVTLDTVPPTFQACDPPDGSVINLLESFTIDLDDDLGVDEDGTELSISRDGQPLGFVRSSAVEGSITATLLTPILDGVYSVSVVPLDDAGNTGAPAQCTIILDRVKPILTSSAPADGAAVTRLENATFALSDDVDVDEEATAAAIGVERDGAPLVAGGDYGLDYAVPNRVTVKIFVPSDSQYVFTVVPVDTAGNEGERSEIAILSDSSAPSFGGSVPAHRSMAESLERVTFLLVDDDGIDEAGTTVEVTRQGIEVTDYSRDHGVEGQVTLEFDDPEPGVYTFEVTPLDDAGNVGPAVTVTIVHLAGPGPRLGDINGDGSVSVVDAFMAAQYEARAIALTADQIVRADVDFNGAVNIIDAQFIALAEAGLVDLPLGIGEVQLEIPTASVAAGETYTGTISLNVGQDVLGAMGGVFLYDPSMVQIDSITNAIPGGILSVINIDNVAGVARFTVANSIPADPAVTGPITVASFDFVVVGSPGQESELRGAVTTLGNADFPATPIGGATPRPMHSTVDALVVIED